VKGFCGWQETDMQWFAETDFSIRRSDMVSYIWG